MPKAKCHALVDKAIAAGLSAIEVYNKPSFVYREETFAILMINAWELLLKARILQLNRNKLKSILHLEHKVNRDGTKSKIAHPKVNRSGNRMTIGLSRAVGLLRNDTTDPLPIEIVENIAMLEEIRDNSIHFHNSHIGLSAKIQEVGTASLRNFVQLGQRWFDCDLSKHNFYLMPMSFHHETDVIQSFSIQPLSKQLSNLVAYFGRVGKQYPSDESRDFNIALRMEAKFVRTSSPDAIKVQFTKDANAPQITVTEEDALKRFPLDYVTLTNELKERFADFKANGHYHTIRKGLEKQGRFCRVRLLDPDNPKSAKKSFYSAEIVREFDAHYIKK